MIEVYHGLWVGGKDDCAVAQLKKYAIVHACKTCHQGFLGYLGRRLEVHDPQYLAARDEQDLYLNLVDAPFEPSVALIEAALGWLLLHHWVRAESTLIHCDQGESRAPSLALLYLRERRRMDPEQFTEKYPKFAPREGMLKMLKRYKVEVEG